MSPQSYTSRSQGLHDEDGLSISAADPKAVCGAAYLHLQQCMLFGRGDDRNYPSSLRDYRR